MSRARFSAAPTRCVFNICPDQNKSVFPGSQRSRRRGRAARETATAGRRRSKAARSSRGQGRRGGRGGGRGRETGSLRGCTTVETLHPRRCGRRCIRAAAQQSKSVLALTPAPCARHLVSLCAAAAWALGTYALQLERDLSLAAPCGAAKLLSPHRTLAESAFPGGQPPRLLAVAAAGAERSSPLLLSEHHRPQNSRRFTGRGAESCASSRTESMVRMRPPAISAPGYRILVSPAV